MAITLTLADPAPTAIGTIIDDLQSYQDGATLHSLNGGRGWGGSYVDRGGSVIKNRVIGGIGDSAIQMGNSRFARPIILPAGWQRIRIGMLSHMTDSGGTLSSVEFAMGLCSGTSAIMGDATPKHFIGYRIHGNTGTMARGTSGFNRYQAGAHGGLAGIKYSVVVNGVATETIVNDDNTGNDDDYYGFGAASNLADRWAHYLDIKKVGGSNCRFQWYNQNVVDIGRDDFLKQISGDVITLPSGLLNNSLGGALLSVDEATNGVLDCINLYWNQTAALFEITNLAVFIGKFETPSLKL